MATKRRSRKSRSSRGGKKPAREKDRYEVTVSRVGIVYTGNNRREALSHFSKYTRAGQDYHVTMYDDDDQKRPDKVAKEHEPMTTLYLTSSGYAKAEREANALQDLLDRDVGFGDANWINIMTQDPKLIARAVEFLGKNNVHEIA